MIPASIRYKNPGAMWGSPLAKKWGASQAVTLNDGLGQGNNIAVFPTYVQGICAQIDLWRGPRYHNMPFAAAIAVWSGHNNVESYIRFVCDRVAGMGRDTVISDAFLNSAQGIAFLKAQAWHEAGQRYPAPDADWIEAQRWVFSGKVILPTAKSSKLVPAAKKTAGAVIVVGGVATATAAAVAPHLGTDIMTHLLAFSFGFAACWFGRQFITDKFTALVAKLKARF